MRNLLNLMLIFSLYFSNLSFGQNPQRVNIKGALQDTLKEPVLFATVMLLNPKDSSLVNFTTSNNQGGFQFANVKNIGYLLKIQHISHIPYQKILNPFPSEAANLEVITLKPMSNELIEVVVKQAKAPLKIRGDTLEYDASTFKVPPGSTVEDLLRRLPGIDVDVDGNIKTQGKDVRRMYVDGKTFFGTDPKAVTKNLGAEAISRVQVFSEKSEQAKLTGVEDGVKEKAMNLELKQEFKKGSFGKISVAAGNEERWASRGSYNRFNDKIQLSFIGYGNNINQTGVNWDDYSEFRGNNSFNEFDNGDFGFGGGMQFYSIGGEGSGLSYYDGRGLTKNFGGGTNLNYSTKKRKFSGSYLYNQTDLDFLQHSFRQTFLENSQKFDKTDTLRNLDFRASHSIGTRYEAELDTFNRVIVKANLRFSQNNNNQNQVQDFNYFGSQPSNLLHLNNSSDLGSFRLTTTAIYRHLFPKKGRSFAISAAWNLNVSDGTRNQNSLNILDMSGVPNMEIRKYLENESNIREIKSSAIFTEPLSKKWYFELFYNLSQTSNADNTQAYNPLSGNIRIDTLSLYAEQVTMQSRLGSSIRYSYNGLNTNIGIAAQSLKMNGLYAQDQGNPWYDDNINNRYVHAIPYVSMNYELPNNVRFSGNYNSQIRAPQYTDLIPLKNTGNPAYIIEGNLDLVPEKMHNFNTSVMYWNQASFMNMNLNFDYSLTRDPITYNQNTKLVPGTGMVTVTKPENMGNRNSFSSYLWSSVPVIKTKFTIDLNGSISYNTGETSINSFVDKLNTDRKSLTARLNITPDPKVLLSLQGSIGFNNFDYEEKSQFDQKFKNHSFYSDLKWQFAKKLFFESNFRYSYYSNSKLNYNQNIPLWNASFRQLFGKGNRFEARAAVFDIFNKNRTLRYTTLSNYTEYSDTNTLARYFMLSLTYNVKGFETKLNRNTYF